MIVGISGIKMYKLMVYNKNPVLFTDIVDPGTYNFVVHYKLSSCEGSNLLKEYC